MDVAKLCSVVGREHTVRELLDDASLARRSGFAVMVPTTAGTGAEATPNSIVAVPEKALKVGIVSDEMLPDAVVLDGELLRGLPAGVAASTGVDALCHAIECFTSRKATPFSDLYALEALRLIFDNIEPACLEAGDMAAKNAMLRAAYYAGRGHFLFRHHGGACAQLPAGRKVPHSSWRGQRHAADAGHAL